MDVVSDNFYELLPEIEKAIEECSFVAIDGEFTGLHNGTLGSVYDTAAQYYEKLRSNCMDFLMVQFGLCVVKYNAEMKKFTYRAYNFYIFPKPMNMQAPDFRFLSQSSCMAFLSNHDFDFNKLFKHGIPYLSALDEQALRDKLLNQYEQSCLPPRKPSKVSTNKPIPDEHRKDIDTACQRVKELLESESSSEVIVAQKKKLSVRQLIHQEVYKQFSDTEVTLQSELIEDIGNVMTAYKGRPKELKAKEKMEQKKIELEKAVGFSAVLKKIQNSNKPVIGHNMTLDVFHMIHQFYLPLPSSYNEFQNIVQVISPRFLDTKYLSKTKPLKSFFNSTVLRNVNKSLAEKCQNFKILEPEVPEVGYSNHTDKLHNAGFDAYRTGSVFVNLCNLYGEVEGIKEQIFPDSIHLKKYENKLYMARCDEDPCLDLAGPEPLLQRSHIYHITFPSDWKSIDITNIFSPYTKVFVKSINNTSAWVALKDASYAEEMNTILPKLQSLHNNIVLLPWIVYHKDANSQINITNTKKKINECSSSFPKEDNTDSPRIRDECAVDLTPEKVASVLRGLVFVVLLYIFIYTVFGNLFKS